METDFIHLLALSMKGGSSEIQIGGAKAIRELLRYGKLIVSLVIGSRDMFRRGDTV